MQHKHNSKRKTIKSQNIKHEMFSSLPKKENRTKQNKTLQKIIKNKTKKSEERLHFHEWKHKLL